MHIHPAARDAGVHAPEVFGVVRGVIDRAGAVGHPADRQGIRRYAAHATAQYHAVEIGADVRPHARGEQPAVAAVQLLTSHAQDGVVRGPANRLPDAHVDKRLVQIESVAVGGTTSPSFRYWPPCLSAP